MITPDTLSAEVIDNYRTCEFTTLGRDGTPMTWPTVTVRNADGTLTVTTCIGFPQKAFNIRRDARVAMLFSDPTASGLDGSSQVLLTGTATCPTTIVTTPVGIETYWSALFSRQPASRSYLGPVARRLTDWYFFRLVITITPTRVVTLPNVSAADAPVKRATSLLGCDVIARVATVVLGACDIDGSPLLTRTVPVATESGYRLDIPADLPVLPGRASLLAHRHDEGLGGLMNALVTGELSVAADGSWLLTPERVVEPSPNHGPLDVLRIVRAQQRATNAYLAKRNLARPVVDWAAFRRVAR